MLRFLCSLALILAIPARAENVTLSADQCAGGERRTEPDGSKAVFLPAAADPKARAEWTFPSPLPPGTYQVEAALTGVGALNNRLILALSGSREIAVELTSFDRDNKNPRFVVSTLAPVSSVYLRKYAAVAQDSVGFSKITFTPIAPAALESDAAFLWLPVVEGVVKTPFTLPGGMYRCLAHQGSAITWKQADGKSFTPPDGGAYVYVDGPGVSVAVAPRPGKKIDAVLLEHLNLPSPDYTLEGNPQGFTAVDPAKTETGELVLNDYQGAGQPEIALFPHGKRAAITSSWDDGREYDLLVAEKLKAHGFKGTFLLNRKSGMISHLQELEALGGEVGSHTWSHPFLCRMTPRQCESELKGMRLFLESQVGHPVISFAYPFNQTYAYDAQGEYVARSVAQGGYLSARATTVGETWIQAISPLIAFNPNCHWLKTKPEDAAHQFKELAAKDGLVFYFWGHSYELEKPEKVADFEAFLTALENQPGTWYATQGEIAIWSVLRKGTVIGPAPGAKAGKAFTVQTPWIHPYLRTTPLSIKVPEGVASVTWNKKSLPVQNGWVDLPL